tara:strand:+ start:361 stop:507 length:147 start_codon:yes stop_codon:yes gene_type:complete
MIDPKTKKIRTRGGTSENITFDQNSLVNPNGFGTAGAKDGFMIAVTRI